MSDREDAIHILDALTQAIERREDVALVTVTQATGVHEASVGRHMVVWPQEVRPPLGKLALGELEARVVAEAREALAQGRHRLLRYREPDGEVAVFVEVQRRPPHLIVVGAGHIAVPLAQMAKLADFQVTVLDDRPEYAHPARFPTADQVIAGPFTEELRRLRQGKPTFDRDTYVVLVTRGHQHDVACLLEILDDPVAYIGMIGSRRRVRAVFELLAREQGIPPEKFDRVHAPIGLDIGAITPAEIAVAILAEIINVMRGGSAEGLSARLRRERQARREQAAAAAREDTGNLPGPGSDISDAV